MSDIPMHQNEKGSLRYLAAQRQLYDEDKRWTTIWFVVTVGLAVVGTGALAIFANYAAIITWLVIVTTVLELLALPRTRSQRTDAAGIQELFDCRVLELPWNDALLDCPDEKLVDDAVQRFNKRQQPDQEWQALENWYATKAVAAAPLSEARLLCQKENIQWNERDRQRLFNWLVWPLIGLFVVLVAVGAYLRWGIDQLLTGPILLALPLAVAVLKYAFEHRAAAERLARLQHVVEDTLREARRPGADPAQIAALSRNVQNEIYRHRRDYVPVPSWLYDRWKKKNTPASV